MNLRSLNSSRRFIPITLVGPPSQYSHLRPVRFATPEDNRKSHKHHPYEPTTSDFYDYTAEELSFDLSRRRLDTFNERFWSDNNIRCEQALKAYVGDSAGEERELLLQKFWKDWMVVNHLPPGKVLAQDNHVNVSVFAYSPNEVSNALLEIDLYTDPVKSYIDSTSGFAYVLTQTECFVWNFAKRSLFGPTAYVFPCPSPIHSTDKSNLSSAYTLPAAILTSSATSREPGLLLISPNGEYRFWEHVGMALSGVDKFIDGQINDLNNGETVTGLYESDLSHYILTTSFSNLKHVVLAPSQGRLYPIIKSFPRTRGVFARLFSSGAYSTSESFSALALSQPDSMGSRDLFALGDRSVQVWSIGYASAAASSSNASKFVGQYSIRDSIAERLVIGNGFDVNKSRLSVTMLDASCTKDGHLAVLVSYVQPSNNNNNKDEQLQSYALNLLIHTQDPTQPWSVDNVIHLNYQAHLDPRPYSIPKLVIYEGGPAFFVVFSDAILISTLSDSLKYSMLLPLRYPLANKFLGYGVPPDPNRAHSSPNSQIIESLIASVYVLAPAGGIIQSQLNLDKLEQDAKKVIDPAARLTSRLKSRLEQAIFYGDKDENPLSFAIPNGQIEGDLQEAAKSVSNDILSSNSMNMPVIFDLRAQINDRAIRSQKLIQFISENGLLGKLAPTTRRQLCDDAEKLTAANELWLHENSFEAGSEGLLEESVKYYMGNYDSNEDVVRVFFKNKVKDVGLLIETMNNIVVEMIESGINIDKKTKVIIESNRYILAATLSAFELRKSKSDFYGLDNSTKSFESWLAKSSTIQLFEPLYERTRKLLRDRSRELGSSIDDNPEEYMRDDNINNKNTQQLIKRQSEQEEIRNQLCQIAEITIEAYNDRIEYLRGSNKTEKELVNLIEKFNNKLRPSLIHPLVLINKSDIAFNLAEKHKAFRILTELCTNDNVGSIDRIKYYLDLFGNQFGFELFKWYVENGKLWTLFQYEESYGELLRNFFEQSDNGRLSWLHDLKTGSFNDASNTLINESSKETELAPKQLMLSLGKLTQMAQYDLDTFESSEAQQAIEATDDKLDLISMHSKLQDLFESELSKNGLYSDKLKLDEKVIKITEMVASKLSLTGLKNHFMVLVKNLLIGQALSAEDLVDLLTLKDNFYDQVTDYASAIDVCVRAKEIPDKRAHSSLKSVWRRVYLRDDWRMLSNLTGINDLELTDNLRSSALYATIQLACQNQHPEALLLSPKKSMNKLSQKDLQARLPNSSSNDIDLLFNDLSYENEQLDSLIKECNLDNWHKEVLRVHSEDFPNEEQQDQIEADQVDMNMDQT